MVRRQASASKALTAVPLHPADRTVRQQPSLARGRLHSLSPDGRVAVEVQGDVLFAAIAAACSETELLEAIRAHRQVLLAYTDGAPAEPLILGIVRDRIETVGPTENVAREAVVEIEAESALHLRVGEASIVLRADGRVEIRGLEIVSIAEGTNRILGGTVGIN